MSVAKRGDVLEKNLNPIALPIHWKKSAPWASVFAAEQTIVMPSIDTH